MKRLRTYGCCYMAAGLLAAALKICYDRAGSDELLWILTPAVQWVRILSGITFEYLPGVGYVNHALRFVVAPSCSGVRFLVIVLLVSVFSFVHRMGTVRRGLIWTLCSAAGAGLYTVFVNGIRIVLSIGLPRLLYRAGAGAEWLTQKRLHTMIGTTVYFIFLLILYQAADQISRKIAGSSGTDQGAVSDQASGSRLSDRKTAFFLPPVFWYYLVVLGIPFLNHAWSRDQAGFSEYACLITGVCLTVLVLRRLLCKTAGIKAMCAFAGILSAYILFLRGTSL